MTSEIKNILIYGALLAGVLTLFKLLEFSFYKGVFELELYLGIVAVLFLGIGVFAGTKIYNTKRQNLDFNKISVTRDIILTQRELEVLEMLSNGYSNKEISDKLFISLNTTKTHISNLYSKIGAKNRVEAVEIAKKLQILSTNT